MMTVTKQPMFFLLLMLLAAACTGGKKRSAAPTPPIDQQTADSSEDVSALQGQIRRLMGQVTALQGQTGGVSQTEVDRLKLEIEMLQTDITTKVTDTAQQEGPLQTELNDLRAGMETLKEKLKEAEAKTDSEAPSDTGSADETSPTEEETAQDEETTGEENGNQTSPPLVVGAPVITVALEQVDKKKDGVKVGTYVTFSSDTDVILTSIKYGKPDITPKHANDKNKDTSPIELYVKVQANHSGKEYCYEARLAWLKIWTVEMAGGTCK